MRASHVFGWIGCILLGAAFGLFMSLGRGAAPHWIVLSTVGAVGGAIVGAVLVIVRVRAHRRALAIAGSRPGAVVVTAIVDRDSREVLEHLAGHTQLPGTVTLVVSDVGISILTGPTDVDQILFSPWEHIGEIGMGTPYLSHEPAYGRSVTGYDRIAIEFIRAPNSIWLQVGLIQTTGVGRYFSPTETGNTLQRIAAKAGRELRRAPSAPI
jgi:hypothetical protein